jgi:hypothetical protein
VRFPFSKKFLGSTDRGVRARSIAFRMVTEASTPVRTISDLQRQLRRRLRVMSAIVGLATGSLGVLAAIIRRASIAADPTTLFTEPPLPGALISVALLFALLSWILAADRSFDLRRLRVVEFTGVAAIASFFVFNQVQALQSILPSFLGKPMEIGISQGAVWAMLIVAYGVLIPSSLRHAVTRTLAIAIVAYLPDLILMPGLVMPVRVVMSYFVLKTFTLAVMSVLAIYGSYRIEELGQQAEVAKELGQYLLRRMLGEGGMGSVYLAEHRLLRRPCAVKLIHADKAGDEVALARFEREVQSAAQLTHPNTVHIYDYGRSDDGTFYFAMEFLPGISLQDLVEKHGPLDPARAVHILAQLCGALQEAHDHGLVHRDLKPANVMLCERGGVHDVAKLLDFGLVAAATSEAETDAKITQAGLVVGTPAYMSPEQCGGDGPVTAASDIYSLGALGYFLLTGGPPFPGKTAMQTLVAHMHDVPSPVHQVRAEVPAALSDVIARCLAKNPGERYASVTALDAALRQSLSQPVWSAAAARDWWSNASASA